MQQKRVRQKRLTASGLAAIFFRPGRDHPPSLKSLGLEWGVSQILELYLCFSHGMPMFWTQLSNISRGRVSPRRSSESLNSKQLVCFWVEKSPKLTHMLLLASRAAGLASSNALPRNGKSLADARRSGAANYIMYKMLLTLPPFPSISQCLYW